MLYYGQSAVVCGGRGGRKPFLAKSFLGVLRDCTRKRVSASLEPKIVFLGGGGGVAKVFCKLPQTLFIL